MIAPPFPLLPSPAGGKFSLKPFGTMPFGLDKYSPLQEGINHWFNTSLGVISTPVVSSWFDTLTGGLIDLAHTVTGNPTLVADQLNGYPAIVFDGSDVLQGALGATYSQPNTIIIICTNPIANYDFIIDGLDTNTTHGIQWTCAAAYRMKAPTNKTVGSLTPRAVRFNILSLVYNGASSVFRQNGVAGIIGNVGTDDLTGLTLGGRFDGANKGNISVTDVIIVDGQLVTTALERIEQYFNRKYGGIF